MAPPYSAGVRYKIFNFFLQRTPALWVAPQGVRQRLPLWTPCLMVTQHGVGTHDNMGSYGTNMGS
jgi:hypothetical protein